MKIFIFFVLFGVLASAHGIHIDCGLSSLWDTELGSSGFPTCHVRSIDYSDNSVYIKSTNMTDVLKAAMKVVDFGKFYKDCDQFNLTFIPKGITKMFSNVEIISFGNCSISSLIGDELYEYPNISTFWLTNTKNLRRIPANFFAMQRNLSIVGLREGNFLMEFGVGLLDNLKNLTAVNVQYNFCINKQATNSSQIPQLIQDIKSQCNWNEPPVCSEHVNSIRELYEGNQVLTSENEKLKVEIADTKTQLTELEAKYAKLKESYEFLLNQW